MAQIITQDGTVIRDGVSRPYRPTSTGRREPPTSADPREDRSREDRQHDAFRAFIAEIR